MCKNINFEALKELDDIKLYKGCCPICKKDFISSVEGILKCFGCSHNFVFSI